MVRKADGDGALFQRLRLAAFFGLGDHGVEVLLLARFPVGDVGHVGPADQARREEAVLVAVLRRDEAVGRQQDRAAKRLKLLTLMPPRAAIVAHEVIVLLEGGIGVSRQHLAMGVDVDARALGLLEQLVQVAQVVATDQDRGAGAHADVGLRRFGVAVGAGVGLVEQAHPLHAHLAAAEHPTDHALDTERVIRGRH